ncbi:MAG TPA: hypothetical protein VLD84_04555 [Nitrososphaeraceae archaeon]|nr:hypothetical protein [Nitrososphaeraceae archaeon]
MDKYYNACRAGTSTVFRIGDFQSTRLPIFNRDEAFLIKTLMGYQQLKGFIKIQDDKVTLTIKGLTQTQQDKEDWD